METALLLWESWTAPGAWQERALLVLLALGLDLIVGDPPRLPHPVVMIGRVTSLLDRSLRRPHYSPARLRCLGLAVAVAVPLGSAAAVWAAVRLARALHPLLGLVMAAWLASTTIAARGLALVGRRVWQALQQGDLPLARRRVGEIVGRDTEQLSESEVCRAAVETVAENTVDACISPLFFTLLFGAPGAMFYRAVNTLDSMLGYKNEKYLHFGWASARGDDGANWLPARIAAWVIPLAAIGLGMDGAGACRVIRRDAHRHPSPNSGIPEAAAAGALGIRLGGLNTYNGVRQHRAEMGDALTPLQPGHITQAIRLMYWSATLSALLFAGSALILAR